MKKKLLPFILLLCTFFVQQNLKAQTVLAPGDIAFIGFQTGTPTDGFSFITLKNIAAGTLIYFTEKGWGNDTWIPLNPEVHLLWTVPSFTPAGTIISIVETEPDLFNVTGTDPTSITIALNTGFNLSAGDQILVYQSLTGPLPASPTFIAGVHADYNSTKYNTETTWNLKVDANAGGSESSLPPALTNTQNCVSLFPAPGPELPNSKYTGTLTGSVASLLSSINNPANWSHNPPASPTLDLGILPSNFPTPSVSTTVVATVTTTTAINVKATSAVLGGTVTTTGGDVAVQRGIVWATTAAPTIANQKVQNGTGVGSFSATITGLPSSTTIYYRAYTTNSAGTSYGTGLTFNTTAALGTSNISQIDVACNGGNTGSASVVVVGGTLPYTYSWSPSGGTDAMASSLAKGTYIVTITDGELNQITQSFTIAAPASPINLASGAQTNVSCNGGTNGTASVTPSGGTPGYTYSWSPSGGTAATATGLRAGTYTVTVTDAYGCTATRTFIITQRSAISLATGSQTNISCNGGSNGSASVTPSGGTPGYTYSWSPAGGTAATATGLAAGGYTVTVTDANGCTATRTFSITEPTVLRTTTTQTNVSCNGGSNGSATVTPSGGTPGYTYLWSHSGATAATATGLAAGGYTVTVTDANGCSTTQSYFITQPSVLTTTGSQTNLSCNGGTTGTAAVTTTGGAGGYTYSWSPYGGTDAIASGLTAGNYTVTVTDANGCTATRTFIITQPSAISTSGTQTNISCNSGSNGSATVTATGGTGLYTYSWFPSRGIAATATGLSAGSYTVIVTDANGCTATRTYAITQPSAISTSASQTNVSCNGGTNGSATVSASGGTPGYTYSWSPSGGTAATASGLTAGTYTVTITDANTCETTQSFTISQPNTLSATTSQTDVLCNGGATGTASVVASGGTGTYSYLWSPSGGTAATATGLTAGNYSCIITDSNGCTLSPSFTISEPGILTATTAKIDATCIIAGQASVTVSGGTASYTYLWSPTGQTTSLATGLTTGNHSVVITDANGCTLTQTFTINTTNTLTATTSQTDVVCNGSNTGSASVTPSGAPGPFTYVWAPKGGTNATANNLTAGNYTVTVTSSNGCSIVKNFTIIEPTHLVVTPSQINLICNGEATGSASVSVTGGTGSYAYQWSPSGGTAATATGLSAGTYTVTIKDANLCQTTQSFIITEPNAFSTTIAQTNVRCNGGTTGSATVTATGGTGAYTYSWSPTGGTAATASGLSAGTYSVTVTDANSCTKTQSVTLTEPDLLIASWGGQTDVSCNGLNDGSATVNVTGGTGTYTYAWSPSGGTAATATGLSPGTYTVTVTDANSCTATQSFTIIEPTFLTASITAQTDVVCNGGTTGSATVTATGGTAAYTYAWSPSGGTAATATGLSAGTYTVTLTDANNCTTTQSVSITEPAPLTSSITTQTDVVCNGETTGSATVKVTGGSGTYAYAWSPSGGTAATATGLSAGIYTLTITDANRCTTTQSVTINQPNTLLASAAAQTNVSCHSGSDGSATVSVTGGTGAYRYQWTPSGGTSETATNLTTGTYTVTVTDANSCTTTQSFTIVEPMVLAVASTQKNVSCYNANNGEADVAVSGGTPPYTYKWSNSDSTNQTVQNLEMGTYICTITDSNNCSINQSFTITQPANPIGLITSLPSDLTASSVTLTINASQNGIDGDKGECTSEIGLVYSTVSNPKISDTKIILGSNPATFTTVVAGLLGNTVYYLRPYAISKFGNTNYGNEISFTTQKYVLNVVATLDQTKVFASKEPVLTYTATGFATGDNNSIITGLLSRDAGENTGTYPITLGSLTAGPNYIIDFKTADFKITKADQIINWNQDMAFGCDNTDQLQLNGYSDSGLPVTYVVENTSIAAMQGGILKINSAGTTAITVSQEGDQNHNAASQITKTIEVSQFGNISQHWDDVLVFDNSSQKYTAFQWYKDGVLIPGANGQYYTEKPLKGIYSLQAKDENGKDIKFCPMTMQGQSFSRAVKVYPNPVQSLKEFTIEADYSVQQLKGSVINIYNLSGQLVTTVTNVSPKMVVLAPSTSAIYVVILTLADGQNKTVNLLVR
jgi:hypothetical protein